MNAARRTHRASSSAAAIDADSDPSPIVAVLVAALVVARLLVPTEASVLGETLWIVQGWFFAGLLWAWTTWRAGGVRLRFDRFDALFWMVVGGHVVSTMAVFGGGGDRRAALNMAWEWVGLGVAFFLLKQVVQTGRSARVLATSLFAVAVCLAGLGLHQHYIELPALARDYDSGIAVLEELESQPPPTTQAAALERQRRVAEIEQRIGLTQVANDAGSRRMWQDRLRSSTEPFGLFALTNTLAGFLSVWFILGAGASIPARRGGWVSILVSLATLGTIALCLVLTKSRTAWVGLAAGATVWGLLAIRTKESWRAGRWLGWSAAAIAVVGVFVGVSLLSGGVDREVLSEAPKSLRYRLQYWTGTWQVLAEQPLFGTGPGNFRQHYLKHKVAESSEEIADPHNFVFDLWASGGLIALAGVLALLYLAGEHFTRRSEPQSEPSRAPSGSDPFDPLVIGVGAGFVLMIAADWLLDGAIDARIAALFGAWLIVVFLSRRLLFRSDLSLACIAASGTALIVHLLGAGGMEMPAIVQTLQVVLVLGLATVPTRHVLFDRVPRPWVHGAIGLVSLVLFAGCLLSASLPVMSRGASIGSGDVALQTRGDARRAQSLYRTAQEQDPLSPDPWQRLADAYIIEWQQQPGLRDESFRRAVAALEQAAKQDPFNPNSYAKAARLHALRYAATRDSADADSAATAFEVAIAMYPTDVTMRAEYAVLLDSADRPEVAAQQADAALRLDAINREQGHADKILPQTQQESLTRIAKSAPR